MVVASTYDSDPGLRPGKKGQSRPGSGVGVPGLRIEKTGQCRPVPTTGYYSYVSAKVAN